MSFSAIRLLAQLVTPRHACIAVFNPPLVETNTVLLKRLTVAHQSRFTRWRVDRDGDTGDLPGGPAYQVIHRFESRVLLFKEDAAIRRPLTSRLMITSGVCTLLISFRIVFSLM